MLIGLIVYSKAMQKVFEKVKIINGTLLYNNTEGTKLEIANLTFISGERKITL